MGYEIKSWFRAATARLLWLIGVMVVLFMAIQCVELPYSNVLSSLFPSHEVPGAENTDLNFTGANAPNVTVNDLSNVVVVQNNVSLNVSSGLDLGSGSDNKSSSEKLDLRKTEAEKIGIQEGFSPANESMDGNSSDSNVAENVGNFDVGLGSPSPAPYPIDFITGEDLGKNTDADIQNPVVSINNTSSLAEKNWTSSLGGEDLGKNTDADIQNPVVSINNTSSLAEKNRTSSLGGEDLGKNTDADIQNPIAFINNTSSLAEKNWTSSLGGDGKPVKVEEVLNMPSDTKSTSAPRVKKETEMSSSAVITIDGMSNLLRESRVSYHSVTPKWSSAADQELLDAKLQIENAPIIRNDAELCAHNYRNLSMFKRSYELMEEKLKVYIYREGERPILHEPFLGGIYASEGWFMRQMETNKQFFTKNPEKAHLFYLPFSSRMLEETLYVQNSHSHDNLIEFLKNYVDLISSKYPFWNRTEGADHFLVACHDWAPTETKKYMANCIRAPCNADMKEGYVFGKDISLPETYVRTPRTPLYNLGGMPPSKRSILAFYAGQMHGYLRPILLQHWENKDPDMKIFGQMPKIKRKRKNKNKNENKMDYVRYMKSSKYCICPRGYEVNSPRVVEAIFYECVPVIISDNFIPPFFEVLNWESFAVFVEEKDVPNLKNILMAIPRKKYLQLQRRVQKVQKHFLWHSSPDKYDIFHMILHSVWYNRVFQMK